MLKGPPSLALRAGLIFMSIYVAVFAAFVAMLIFSRSFEVGLDPYAGANMAVAFARDELSEADGSFTLANDGSFAQLAARNPTMWLVARRGDRSFTFGHVPQAAVRLFEQYRGSLDTGRFRVPGAPAEIAGAKLERHGSGSDSLLLVAGGVDPATLSAGDALRQLSPEGVLIAFVFIGVLGLVAMAVALPLFARAIRPIADEAGSVAPQDPGRRLDERKAPRELLPLVRAFNATLDRLAAELTRRKRFITDVAHELRTPLAVVALRVEAMEEEGAKQDLRRGVGRLTHLVAQMLDLERLSLSAHQRRPVDLVAVGRDVLADLAPMAMKAGYEVSLDAPETPVTVTGDEHAIARAMTNLIGNSVTHGGGSGQIRVAVRAEGVVEVADEGPGIPASLLPHLFEPFSRGSASAEGCGLGLHLTREIMRGHGGEVSLAPSPRGATFRLSFPSPQNGKLSPS
jgi:signal transduction histidine kinase